MLTVLIMIIVFIGIIAMLTGAFWLIFLAFRTSVLWGIAVLCFHLPIYIFIIEYWSITKRPFLIQIAGFVLMFTAFLLPHGWDKELDGSGGSIVRTEQECSTLGGKMIDGNCIVEKQNEQQPESAEQTPVIETVASNNQAPVSEPENITKETTESAKPDTTETQLAHAEPENQPPPKLRIRKRMTEAQKEVAFRKSFRPRAECEEPDLAWEQTIKCSNEKMVAHDKFDKTH